MKVRCLKINSFQGNKQIEFYPDDQISVLTGSNGSGKTSVMKMLWAILSGNISIALREIEFSSATLETTSYTCNLTKMTKSYCKIDIFQNNELVQSFKDSFLEDEDGDLIRTESAEDKAAPFLMKEGSSLFFPTFRRIEGGFGINSEDSYSIFSMSDESKIDGAFAKFSKRLTKGNHKFITSISAQDVSEMFQFLYWRISSKHDRFQQKRSSVILEKISSYETNNSKCIQADDVLKEINEIIKETKEKQEEMFKPFEQINEIIKFLFHDKSDSFIKRLTFGKNLSRSTIDKLSSGEKQMLGFIAYNATNRNTVIIIDEPELSLHTDWQRQLFPVLLRQNPTNQFIVSTHSPLIYSKYPESEFEVK